VERRHEVSGARDSAVPLMQVKRGDADPLGAFSELADHEQVLINIDRQRSDRSGARSFSK